VPDADEALRKGMKAASDSFAHTMRTVSGARTRSTAAAVNVQEGDDEWLIRGGQPGGEYGWEPIQALMFDNNQRHPLFGDRRHWYQQSYKKGALPITENTLRDGIDDAVDAFADEFIPAFAEQYGFDE
jgi:hypothetical protein